MKSFQLTSVFAVDPVCLSSMCCWASFEKSEDCTAPYREAEWMTVECGGSRRRIPVGPKKGVSKSEAGCVVFWVLWHHAGDGFWPMLLAKIPAGVKKRAGSLEPLLGTSTRAMTTPLQVSLNSPTSALGIIWGLWSPNNSGGCWVVWGQALVHVVIYLTTSFIH